MELIKQKLPANLMGPARESNGIVSPVPKASDKQGLIGGGKQIAVGNKKISPKGVSLASSPLDLSNN